MELCLSCTNPSKWADKRFTPLDANVCVCEHNTHEVHPRNIQESWGSIQHNMVYDQIQSLAYDLLLSQTLFPYCNNACFLSANASMTSSCMLPLHRMHISEARQWHRNSFIIHIQTIEYGITNIISKPRQFFLSREWDKNKYTQPICVTLALSALSATIQLYSV